MRTLSLFGLLAFTSLAPAQGLDKQKLLDAQTFWDNKDWDWYKSNIPFFDCPDPDIVTTYYYRWELLTKHLTYGSPNSGYSFTEFIDRPFWSGAYGSISCPAGLQLYEARWLQKPMIARDYARYWFKTAGAEPRRYSTWLADSVLAVSQVHGDKQFAIDLLPDLVKNYEGWETTNFDKKVGLFWQTGHDDGMEYNINSRQTADQNRGAPAFRPTLNTYMYADALAIAKIADLKGDKKIADAYRAKAAALKDNLQKKLWDPKRKFLFPMALRDEELAGAKVNAGSLTHQTGKYAGSEYGRELIGYVPWQFNLPDAGYEAAWKPLMDKDGFFAPFGPTTVEAWDPLFKISNTCCWWSGNSWPYATSQTLKAMANLLQNYKQNVVTKDDYVKLLTIYAKTHRKNGKPYLAEACNPDTGSWEGHDSYNHSEHYFHSNYIDLVITGLMGLIPRDDDTLELKPLAPPSWEYFAIKDVKYRGRVLTVMWDREGKRYELGKGFHVLVDEEKVASADALEPLTIKLPALNRDPRMYTKFFNFAVNNDGNYYPRVSASYTGPNSSVSKLNDGNYWYHAAPPNRWTCEGSPNKSDLCVIDFGIPRRLWEMRLFVLDDGAKIVPPARIEVEYWDGKSWKARAEFDRTRKTPAGRRVNSIYLANLQTEKIRVTLTHADGGKSGLSELEAWGPGVPGPPVPPPTNNLADNPGGKPFPKASASFTSRYDKVEHINDGKVRFNPSPNNRWTSYESPNKTDWLEIDFGAAKAMSRVELAIYDDRGGVQAPETYEVQFWDGADWKPVAKAKRTPERPTGGQFNELTFEKVTTTKVRIVFTHRGKARSGVSEVFVWEE